MNKNDKLKFKTLLAFFLAVFEKFRDQHQVKLIKMDPRSLFYVCEQDFDALEPTKVSMIYSVACVIEVHNNYFILAVGEPQGSERASSEQIRQYPLNILALPVDLKSNKLSKNNLRLAVGESIETFKITMKILTPDPRPSILKSEHAYESVTEFIARTKKEIGLSGVMQPKNLVKKTVAYIVSQLQSSK